jgi:hypothetical protein
MLDHTGRIDQVVPPVLIAVPVAVAGRDQLGVSEKVPEIDIGGGDMIRVRIDGHEIFLTAAQPQKTSRKNYDSNFIIHVH